MKRKLNSTVDLVMIPLFAAINYVVLMFFFFPTYGMFIHFGNMVVVFSALLIGGWQGGLAGSIGMGLFDMLNGHADSAPKTILFKFVIGITVGVVYTMIKKRDKYPIKATIISALALFLTSASIFVFFLNRVGGFNVMGVTLVVLTAVLGLLFVLFAILGKKLPPETSAAAVSAVCGMTANLICEFVYKLVLYTAQGNAFQASFVRATLEQPSTVVNAVTAIIGGVMLYTALRKPYSIIKYK